MNNQRTTVGKALDINLDPLIYGTFAEIGAGQEVARYFFQAGKASQTIAKTISAYDMIYSDEIYGKEESGRYVCESRLIKMLDKEYSLLQRRLKGTRGAETCFFAFANTVATGDNKKRPTHGWMGIRFEPNPGAQPSDIVLHVRLLDRHRLQQQEALGVLGVNLVSAAFRRTQSIEGLISALVENLKMGQVAIDMIRVSGSGLAHLSNHLLNLELVKHGLAEVILFGPDESILSLGDTLYQQPLIIERGDFNPITTTHLELISRAADKFKHDFAAKIKNKSPLFLFELTMKSLKDETKGKLDSSDFLQRVRALAQTGASILVSNFELFYQLKQHLRMSTEAPIALVLSTKRLERIFEPTHYTDLSGGLLEGLGKLLDPDTCLYVYPHKTKDRCQSLSAFFPEQSLLPIFQYFKSQNWITELSGCDDIAEYIHSDAVRKMIQEKNSNWETFVPEKVATLIKKDGLFGYRNS